MTTNHRGRRLPGLVLLVRAPGVRAYDRDPERQRLRVRIVRGPEHGTLREELRRLGPEIPAMLDRLRLRADHPPR